MEIPASGRIVFKLVDIFLFGLFLIKLTISSFDDMLDFAKKCKAYVPNVVLTVVDIIGEEKIEACQKITDEIGVTLRVRPFEE